MLKRSKRRRASNKEGSTNVTASEVRHSVFLCIQVLWWLLFLHWHLIEYNRYRDWKNSMTYEVLNIASKEKQNTINIILHLISYIAMFFLCGYLGVYIGSYCKAWSYNCNISIARSEGEKWRISHTCMCFRIWLELLYFFWHLKSKAFMIISHDSKQSKYQEEITCTNMQVFIVSYFPIHNVVKMGQSSN